MSESEILIPREGLLLALGLLDEQRDGLSLDRLVVGGARLREGLRRRLGRVALLRLDEQRREGCLADVQLPDRRDVLRFQARAATATAPCEQGGDEDEQEREMIFFIRKRRLSSLARGQHSIDQIERSLEFIAS